MESEAEAKRRRLEARMGGAAPGPSVAGPSAPLLPPPREAFVAEANKALFFRLVRTAAELATAPLFNPEFTHQVFREDETVFGYCDLKARGTAPQAGGLRHAFGRRAAVHARRRHTRSPRRCRRVASRREAHASNPAPEKLC